MISAVQYAWPTSAPRVLILQSSKRFGPSTYRQGYQRKQYRTYKTKAKSEQLCNEGQSQSAQKLAQKPRRFCAEQQPDQQQATTKPVDKASDVFRKTRSSHMPAEAQNSDDKRRSHDNYREHRLHQSGNGKHRLHQDDNYVARLGTAPISAHNSRRQHSQHQNGATAAQSHSAPDKIRGTHQDLEAAAKLHPGQINQHIVKATSAEEILRVYAEHKDGCNVINLTTAFHRLAKVTLFHTPYTNFKLIPCLHAFAWNHMHLHASLVNMSIQGIKLSMSQHVYMLCA